MIYANDQTHALPHRKGSRAEDRQSRQTDRQTDRQREGRRNPEIQYVHNRRSHLLLPSPPIDYAVLLALAPPPPLLFIILPQILSKELSNPFSPLLQVVQFVFSPRSDRTNLASVSQVYFFLYCLFIHNLRRIPDPSKERKFVTSNYFCISWIMYCKPSFDWQVCNICIYIIWNFIFLLMSGGAYFFV